MIEVSVSGSVPLTNGSGSDPGGPKTYGSATLLNGQIFNYFSSSQPARDSGQLQRCGCGRLLNTGSKKSHSLGDSRIGPPQIQFVLFHLAESREILSLNAIIRDIVRVCGTKKICTCVLKFSSTDHRLPVI
jgi:hypothetical protein